MAASDDALPPPSETVFDRSLADEAATRALAEDLAAILAPGDVVALVGDLGAGKSTLARALIRALADDDGLEVPSPTFTLVQDYETRRFAVSHFDLYRLSDADELDELGFDEAVERGAVLVEWPDRAGDRLPADALIVRLDMAAAPDARRVRIEGDAARWAARLERTFAIRAFLDAHGRGGLRRRHLQGDASTRSYERLYGDGETLVLMNHPAEADDALGRARVAARAAARLAEGPRPFLAFALALSEVGVRVPAVLAHDLDRGLLLLEDLGSEPCVAGRPPSPIPERYTVAAELLAALHARDLPATIPDGVGGSHAIPVCDRSVLAAEVGVFLEWGFPRYAGRQPSPDERAAFLALWEPLFDEILAGPVTWMLRDYHSPNLLWLAHETGIRRLGVLDFQDTVLGHPAYDVVSLVEDARVDVAADLETALVETYLARRRGEPGFDEAAFRRALAILSAQRNTRILGVFARLCDRDGKPGYLAHVPRLWTYLDRVLDEPVLRPLKLWYEDARLRQRP
jgi:tRNA threonylcarbamoyl adenosine modification protein YjeE